MSKSHNPEKLVISNHIIEIITTVCLLLLIALFIYYVTYYSNERMISIINEETSILNNPKSNPIKEDVYITTQQEIEKRGQLIEKQSATYISDNKKYTLVLVEKMIIRIKYSKSSKNNLMEIVSFLKNHSTENDCKQGLEKTSHYFINKTKSLLYPEYKKVATNNGYLYHYEGFVGMKVPTMEFYCKGSMEIAKINIMKEKLFTDFKIE